MAKFESNAPTVGVSLPSSVVGPADFSGATGLVDSFLSNRTLTAAAQAKAEAEARRAAALLAADVESQEIERSTLLGEDAAPILKSLRAEQTRFDLAAEQGTSRQSDVVKLRQETAARRSYRQALEAGDTVLAEKLSEQYRARTGVSLGQAVGNVLERQEVSQEKLQERLQEINMGVLKQLGRTDLINSYKDPAAQEAIQKTLMAYDAHTRNTQRLDDILKHNQVIQSNLSTNDSLVAARNKETLVPAINAFMADARAAANNAVQASYAIPLKGADPELVSAHTNRVRAQFSAIEQQIRLASRPGTEAEAANAIAFLKDMEQDALAAATNEQARKTVEDKLAMINATDASNLPEDVRKAKQLAPIFSAVVAADKALLSTETQKAIQSSSGFFMGVLENNISPAPARTTMMTPQQAKQALPELSKSIIKNAEILGLPDTEMSAGVVVQYLTGAANDLQALEGNDSVAYGEFLSNTLANPKASAELWKHPAMNARARSAVTSGLSLYGHDLEASVDQYLKTKQVQPNLGGSRVAKSDALPVGDLIAVSVKGDSMVATPKVSAAALSKKVGKLGISPIELDRQARIAANEFNSVYLGRYRAYAAATKNLTGQYPEETKAAALEEADAAVQEAAPAPVPEPVVDPRKVKLEKLLQSLSDEDIDLLLKEQQ